MAEAKNSEKTAVAGASHAALARKYRPQVFAELIGQDAMVRTLRNAFASGGVVEDPATGAAAAALAGMLRDGGWLGAGRLSILQGEDMGRPSLIEATFTNTPGSSVSVGGAAVEIARPEGSGA